MNLRSNKKGDQEDRVEVFPPSSPTTKLAANKARRKQINAAISIPRKTEKIIRRRKPTGNRLLLRFLYNKSLFYEYKDFKRLKIFFTKWKEFVIGVSSDATITDESSSTYSSFLADYSPPHNIHPPSRCDDVSSPKSTDSSNDSESRPISDPDINSDDDNDGMCLNSSANCSRQSCEDNDEIDAPFFDENEIPNTESTQCESLEINLSSDSEDGFKMRFSDDELDRDSVSGDNVFSEMLNTSEINEKSQPNFDFDEDKCEEEEEEEIIETLPIIKADIKEFQKLGINPPKPQIMPPRRDSELKMFIRSFFPADYFHSIQFCQAKGTKLPEVKITSECNHPLTDDEDITCLVIDALNELNASTELSDFFYEMYLDYIEYIFETSAFNMKNLRDGIISFFQSTNEKQQIKCVFECADKIMHKQILEILNI